MSTRRAILLRPALAAAIAKADVILSLDWVDLAGTLQAACGGEARGASVIQVSLDHTLHGGWSMDYQGLPPVDCMIAAEPDSVGAGIARRSRPSRRARATYTPRRRHAFAPAPTADGLIATDDLAVALRRVAGDASRIAYRICRCHGTARAGRSGIRWTSSAPTAAAASAAAPAFPSAPRSRCKARESCRSAICGDGDFLMGATVTVDGRALPHSAAARGRQQPLVLQRRSASGARRADARSAGREQVDRPAHRRPRHRPGRDRRARRARSAGDRSNARRPRARVRGGDRRRSIAGGVAVVDVRVQPGYTPAMTAALTTAARK